MAFSHAVAELTRYTVNFEALLTFYPVTTAARLQGPRLIPLTGSVSSDDAVLVAGNPQSFLLGTGSESEAIWFGNAEPHAELTFKLNDSYTIELELNAAVGSASRNLHLVLNADVTTPFMVNVVVSDDDPAQDARSTAVTVQGMAFAGARPPIVTSQSFEQLVKPFIERVLKSLAK